MPTETLNLAMEVRILDEKMLYRMLALCNAEGLRPGKEPETATFLDTLAAMLNEAMETAQAAPVPPPQSLAALDVAAERRRQIKKGHNLAIDVQHNTGTSLPNAMIAYTLWAMGQGTLAETYYPWGENDSHTERGERRHLVIATALGLAAIERLDEIARLRALPVAGAVQ